MSSFGTIPNDLSAAHADFLISSANKCIEGVPGFAFILARRGRLIATQGCARTLSLDLHAQWRGLETAASSVSRRRPTISSKCSLPAGGAPVNLGGPAVLELGGQRAAVLICYEQVIPLDGPDRRDGPPNTFRGPVKPPGWAKWHLAPQPKTPIASLQAGLAGVIGALLSAQHVLEIFRRTLPRGASSNRLDRLTNRLTNRLNNHLNKIVT
jgi:hypothetical protein